jgi:hypothetical protein
VEGEFTKVMIDLPVDNVWELQGFWIACPVECEAYSSGADFGLRPRLNFPKGALFHGVKIEGLKKIKAGKIYCEKNSDH